MTTLHLRDAIPLGPSTTKLELLAIEVNLDQKRIFLRYTPPGPEGGPDRSSRHEQMETLTDAPIPIEPPKDDDKDADAAAQKIYRDALRDAKSKQLYTDFLADKTPLVDRAHDYFARVRGLRRA